ncbi:MAG: hypothetical protein HC853_06065 [Anaerolineae bacterium]|nr:hypothetical protein [Anaerolineae bacterium]
MEAIRLQDVTYAEILSTLATLDEFINPTAIRTLFTGSGELGRFYQFIRLQEDDIPNGHVGRCLDVLLKHTDKRGTPGLLILLNALEGRYKELGISNNIRKLRERVEIDVSTARYTQFATPSNRQLSDFVSELREFIAANICPLDDGYGFKAFCFELGIDHEEFRPGSYSDQSAALVQYCQRRGDLPRLTEQCRRTLKNSSLPDPSSVVREIRTQRAGLQRQRFAELICENFSEDEFRVLCFDLAIDYNLLTPMGFEQKALAVVTSSAYSGQWQALEIICSEHRPHVRWPQFPSDLKLETEGDGPSLIQKQRRALRIALSKSFSSEELRILCFDTGATLEILALDIFVPKSIFTVNIIEHFERRNEVNNLIAYCLLVRPFESLGYAISLYNLEENPSFMMPAERAYLSTLRQMMTEYFSADELLNLAKSFVPKQTFLQRLQYVSKQTIALEIVLTINPDDLPAFVERVKTERPLANWDILENQRAKQP